MNFGNHKNLDASERIVRIINVLTLIIGLGFLVAAGVDPELDWALIGITPLSLSAILGLAVLLYGSKWRALITIADFLIAGFALGMDSWGWALGWKAEMIGGHALAILLMVFLAHSFFVLRAVIPLMNPRTFRSMRDSISGRNGCARCPHCLNEARVKKTTVQAVGGKETYHRVPGRDDEYDDDADGTSAYRDARPSTDDEAARLV